MHRNLSGAQITFALPPRTAVADLPQTLAERAETQAGGRIALPTERVTADSLQLAAG